MDDDDDGRALWDREKGSMVNSRPLISQGNELGLRYNIHVSLVKNT